MSCSSHGSLDFLCTLLDLPRQITLRMPESGTRCGAYCNRQSIGVRYIRTFVRLLSAKYKLTQITSACSLPRSYLGRRSLLETRNFALPEIPNYLVLTLQFTFTLQFSYGVVEGVRKGDLQRLDIPLQMRNIAMQFADRRPHELREWRITLAKTAFTAHYNATHETAFDPERLTED